MLEKKQPPYAQADLDPVLAVVVPGEYLVAFAESMIENFESCQPHTQATKTRKEKGLICAILKSCYSTYLILFEDLSRFPFRFRGVEDYRHFLDI